MTLLYDLGFQLEDRILTWKGGSFEFDQASILQEEDICLTDVLYILKLCCYENEQSDKFKIGLKNNRSFAKEQGVKIKGGLWSSEA